MHLAFIGCAHIHTQDFVERLRRRRDTEDFRWNVAVRLVWDHDRTRAEQTAAALGSDARPTVDLDEVLSDPEVDGVVIASENVRHPHLVAACARAGKHIFVDKPLALTAADAYRLAAEVDRRGIIFQTGYLRRAEPAALFLRGAIQAGHLGTVTRARVVIGHAGALEGWFDNQWRWMADPEQAGFGGFGDVATHAVDLLQWVLGDRAAVAQVTAKTANLTGRYPGTDEYGEALMVFEDGTLGSVAGSWIDRTAPLVIEIAGTEGHAHFAHGQLRYSSEHVAGADGRTPWTDLPSPLPHAFDLYLDALLGASDVPLVGVWEAADRVAVMEAMYDAAGSGRWVSPTRPPTE